MTELLNNLNASRPAPRPPSTRPASPISRASDGEQVPSVSSSLLEDVRIGG